MPASVPTTYIGSPVLSVNRHEREMPAASTRNRYTRGLTFIVGHGTPLTSTVSPMKPTCDESSKDGEPSALNDMSETISGTSNSPWGSCARSYGSDRWYCAAIPLNTFCAVSRWLWSWYQRVRACCQFGYL